MMESPVDLDIEARQEELPELPGPLRRQGHPSVIKTHIGSSAGIYKCPGVRQCEIRMKKPLHRREAFVVGWL